MEFYLLHLEEDVCQSRSMFAHDFVQVFHFGSSVECDTAALTRHMAARRSFVSNCRSPFNRPCNPLPAHQVRFTFYLMNSTAEVIGRHCATTFSSELHFFGGCGGVGGCFYLPAAAEVAVLTLLAPGLIFSLKGLLSNNEI